MPRWFLLFAGLFVAVSIAVPTSAEAATIAIVDFQRAVNETKEGKDAQSRLDTMYASRKKEIDRLREELENEAKDFQARAMILSDSAREEAQQSLLMKQQRFEGTYMQYQQEMQQTYMALLQELDDKMRRTADTIAREKGYDLVLDRAAVVYFQAGGEVVDMTDALVNRYNADNP